MKTKLMDVNGNKIKEIEVPKFFSEKIRENLVAKIVELKKTKQPYSPSLIAGKQHSASGKVIHRRHVWRSGYGRGMSRIPRKILSRRGSQSNMIGAEISSTRGGRRAHPPKTIAAINNKKINKKEMKLAILSALSATANREIILKKYENLNLKNMENLEKLPLVVESKITDLKTKEFISSLNKILGKEIFDVISTKKRIRSGKGKMRGRRYKKNAGLLIVLGNKEKIKYKGIDFQQADNLGVSDLAKGGIGRLTLYTENAIKELKNKFENQK